MKVAINRCYGGFVLSDAAKGFLKGRGWSADALRRLQDPETIDDGMLRSHGDVVEAVALLGTKGASSIYSSIELVMVPDGITYGLMNFDGMETVYEIGRIWPERD